MPKQTSTVLPVDSFRKALRNQASSLKDQYKNDPIGLAERLGLRLPKKPVAVMVELELLTEEEAIERYGPNCLDPGLRELVEDVCSGKETSAAVVGPRGGGKSQGVSFIEFKLTFLDNFDALNLGGSELQADQVYQYLLAYIESDPYWKDLIKGEAMRERTNLLDGNWIRVLAASQKSTRSPHAGGGGGKRRGGILVIDEEAEADDGIVDSALPTINTAVPSVNVRSSTFHNNVGSFADLIENHEQMGYTLYQWDIFDVAERCKTCVNVCQSEEKCFREDHIEKVVDPDTGKEEDKLIHKAYCGGKALYADGWIPMLEIHKLWRRMNRAHETWEVEAMGSRPSSAGYVIKDQIKHAKNVTKHSGSELYLPGGPISICVDWGTVAAGVEVWQAQFGSKINHVLLHADQVEQAGIDVILGKIFMYRSMYLDDFTEVAADIGGGGNYLNKELREKHRIACRDVNFNMEKEAAAAAWNVLSEHGQLVLPSEHEVFHKQVKRWRRNSQGHIIKGNDHLCDAAICYFAKFIDEMGLTNIRIIPRSFSSAGLSAPPEDDRGEAHQPATGRVAVIRSFGGSKRR